MIERPSQEWFNSFKRIFGPNPPKGVSLRGDGTSIFYSQYEICLGRIHLLTKSYYQRNAVALSYYEKEKHLADQERSLFLMCYDFELELKYFLNRSSYYYDFVVRPHRESSFFELGLADLIYVTDLTEIPFVLEFHFNNHINVERGDVIHFFQVLQNYVPHFLRTRYPTVDKEKIETVVRYTFSMVSSLSQNLREEYYWFKDEYVRPEEGLEQSGLQDSNDCTQTDDDLPFLNKDIQIVENEVDSQTQTMNKASEQIFKIKYRCTKSVLEDYFNLLSKANDNGLVFLNKEAVEWVLANFFDPTVRVVLKKPEFDSNLKRNEILFFFRQYFQKISPGSGGYDISTLREILKVPKECFPDFFSKTSVDTLYKNLNVLVNEDDIDSDHPLRLENCDIMKGRF